MTGLHCAVIPHILEQHAEDAAFLWLLRDGAVRAPNYSLDDLGQLDRRLDAHIDGLHLAGGAGWEICAQALGHGEPGELFVAAVLALRSDRSEAIRRVYAALEAQPAAGRGLVSALGWLDWQDCVRVARGLASAAAPFWQGLGIAAFAAQRIDAGAVLTTAIEDPAPDLRALALRAGGVLGRCDLLPALRVQLQAAEPQPRFWAACSGVLLGDRGAALWEAARFAEAADSPYAERALEVALRALRPEEAMACIERLARRPDTLRKAVIACGVLGDASNIPWLIEQMAVPDLARVAGESFALITGADLSQENLEGEWPETFMAGPTENPADEDVAMDADEDLPWPEAGLVSRWWTQHQGRFRQGTRYLLGKPLTPEHLRWVLRCASQRQRQAAALELALLRPAAALFETRAPGFKQQRLLGPGP